MGGRSSHHHHYHTDTESQQRATEAVAAAAAAQATADAAQRALEEQKRANERLFEEQRRAQAEAAEREHRAREEHQRQFEEAQRQHRAEAAAAAQRLEEQRQAAAQAEAEGRRRAAAAAQQLEEQRQRAAAEAAEWAMRLEEQRAEAERRVQEELEQERARAHAQRLQEWRSRNRDYPIPDFLRPYVSEVLEDAAEDAGQDRRVNIGVLGNSGTGKSSLIKTILERFSSNMEDQNVPRPLSCFEGDGTQAPTPYTLGDYGGKVVIWDLPGQGTEMFPARTYLCNMGLKYFDAVLVITDGRWTENDRALQQAIKFANIWCDVVRTKVDLAVDDARNDHGMTQEDCLQRVQATLQDQIPEQDASKLHLVTTRRRFWAGGHGDHKFGTIDGLCDRVEQHIESQLGRALGEGCGARDLVAMDDADTDANMDPVENVVGVGGWDSVGGEGIAVAD